MKARFKFFQLLLLSAVFILSSCSGEDGEMGPQGPQGTQGVQGLQGDPGPQGNPGQDGNANVQTILYDVSTESGSQINLSVSQFTQSVLDNDVILWYIDVGNLVYPIPGSGPNAQYVVRVYAQVNTTRLSFHNWDGTSYSISAGDIDEVKIIIIESSNTTTGKSTSTKSDVFNELKQAGVDVNDYYAVLDYYGIDY